MFGNYSNRSQFDSEENKRGLNYGNSCYLTIHNLLSSHLLYKNLNITVIRFMILLVVL
jgi:hypothetical protein